MSKITSEFTVEQCLERVLISEAQLCARIAELGTELSRDYAGKTPLLICILRGGVVFLTDLMRCMTIPHEIDFMAVSSYGVGARASNGSPRINLDLNVDIAGRHVLLVEDIVDSGHTLSQVLDLLQTRKPASLKLCTLLDKKERRVVAVTSDYVGFSIPNEYVFGYGLDVDELFRHVRFVGVLKKEYQ